jgi:hypothetical protein
MSRENFKKRLEKRLRAAKPKSQATELLQHSRATISHLAYLATPVLERYGYCLELISDKTSDINYKLFGPLVLDRDRLQERKRAAADSSGFWLRFQLSVNDHSGMTIYSYRHNTAGGAATQLITSKKFPDLDEAITKEFESQLCEGIDELQRPR